MTGEATTPRDETAVIDRFEGPIAVLLIGDTQQIVNLPANQLPLGAQAGQWLRIQLDGDRVVGIEIDLDATAAAEARIAEKLARLRQGDHLR
jgi:DUF3006 family protein